MSRIFLSDLHLESTTSKQYQSFKHILHRAVQDQHKVYILGDLVEVWIGDDDDSCFADSLRSDLSWCGARTATKVMHGNRDFLFRADFAADANVELLNDPFKLTDSDLPEPVLLAHGDAYCTSDIEYMRFRAFTRSKEWQDNLLMSSLSERRDFALGLRSASKRANALKAENITDVEEAEVLADLKRNDCSLMIHGHTHRPAIHNMAEGCTRWVLGDWTDYGWVLRQSEAEFSLERFSIP